MSQVEQYVCDKCNQTSPSSVCMFCTLSGVTFAELMNAAKLAMGDEQSADQAPSGVDSTSSIHKVSVPLCRIGRATENDLVIEDASVSRCHACIIYEDGRFVLEDLGSRNGTFLQGFAIRDKSQLEDGHIITFGLMRFRFQISIVRGQEPTAVLVRCGAQFTNSGGSVESPDSVAPATSPSASSSSSPSLSPTQSPCNNNGNGNGNNGKPTQAVSKQSDIPPLMLPFEARERLKQLSNDIADQQSNAAHAWSGHYLRNELDSLKGELDPLRALLEETQAKLENIQSQLGLLEGMRDAILAGSSDEFTYATRDVLEFLGWVAEMSTNDPRELRLSWDDKTEALVRVCWCTRDLPRGELGQLVVRKTNHWVEFGEDSKGILIVAMRDDVPPWERSERQFIPDDLVERAETANICLVTDLELLSLLTAVELGGSRMDSLRQYLLSSKGRLNLPEAMRLTPTGHKKEGESAPVVDAPADEVAEATAADE